MLSVKEIIWLILLSSLSTLIILLLLEVVSTYFASLGASLFKNCKYLELIKEVKKITCFLKSNLVEWGDRKLH